MLSHDLISQAHAAYAARVQKDPKDTYAAYRLMEQSWQLPLELVRAALVRLLETDPWFLTAMQNHALRALTTEDIERVSPFVGAGLPAGITARLRAQLWYGARRGPYHPDEAGLLQLQTALEHFLQVPDAERDQEWHRMVVDCYYHVDYDQYKQAIPALLAASEPNWRGAHLSQVLKNAAKRSDWALYDQYRPAWDLLPPSRHICQCKVNSLYTNDGLRAIAAGHWAVIPAALTKAAAVTGCPHLNTGGLSLSLVEQLIDVGQYLDEARAYLQVAMKFESHRGNNEVIVLAEKLEAVAKQKRSRQDN